MYRNSSIILSRCCVYKKNKTWSSKNKDTWSCVGCLETIPFGPSLSFVLFSFLTALVPFWKSMNIRMDSKHHSFSSEEEITEVHFLSHLRIRISWNSVWLLQFSWRYVYFCLRCGNIFCSMHRYSETHDCTYDYKSAGRRFLQETNPIISAPKLPKIWRHCLGERKRDMISINY